MIHIVSENPAVRFTIGHYTLLWIRETHHYQCDVHSIYANASSRPRMVGKLDVPAAFFNGHDMKAESAWTVAAGFTSQDKVCLPRVRQIANRFGKALDEYDRRQYETEHYQSHW